MVKRIIFAATLAVLGVFAATGNALAAKGPDADEVQVWMGIGLGILMAVLLLAYAAKWYLGLDAGAPPPIEDDGHGHGGHDAAGHEAHAAAPVHH